MNNAELDQATEHLRQAFQEKIKTLTGQLWDVRAEHDSASAYFIFETRGAMGLMRVETSWIGLPYARFGDVSELVDYYTPFMIAHYQRHLESVLKRQRQEELC